MRHVVHAAKAFAVDKNTDHTIQDFIYSTRHVRPVPVRIDADETLDALDQRISSAKAKAPEPPTELDLAHDAFALIDSLKSLAHFLTTSSAFCLILSDILTTARQLVAEGAAQAATFAHEVEVAADNVNKVSQFGNALLTILSILTKYTTTLRASANLLSEAPMSPRTISAIPVPTIDIDAAFGRALSDLCTILEHLPGGHSLQPIFAAFLDVTKDLLFPSSPQTAAPNLHTFFTCLDAYPAYAPRARARARRNGCTSFLYSIMPSFALMHRPLGRP
ncbi:hypothetical protein HGRIS_011917 [Hohenbuehelia grisea]|uniref:HAM1-like N-terminal domain-containing protein n=1 Tax=Hohenbuehelia grisea TaxID=104357 RepID=A0ABR3JWJ1_9AGAR